MKKRPFLLLLSICYALNAFAQFETDYKPVVSRGNLPRDFVTLSAQKYNEAKEQLGKEEKRSTRKDKEKFLLQSNFGIDNVLLSGKVLFNDPLAEYVNKVADQALVSEPEVRKELRFYILKSSMVNAFATNQGIVFVTMGMLAQLEDEAQLAFVLCHEVVHYKEKHAIEKFLETENMSKGKGAYKQLSLDDKVIARCAFTKEQEKEADEKGMQIFLKSKYSTSSLMGVYDVLKYSYLPFDDVAFEKSFLENESLKFPDDYIIKNTNPIDTKDTDDEEEEHSTHPSIKYRREKTAATIKDVSNAGKGNYQVGEKDFKKIREMARFELCRLYTLRHSYEMGIYTSYMLLKKYPDNKYLKKNVAFCLGGLAQYANNGDFKEVHYNSDSVEGKSQALFYLTWRLDSVKADLNIVALAYATKLKTQYPKDDEIQELYKNLFHSLVSTNEFKYTDFQKTGPPPKTKEPAPVAAPVVKDTVEIKAPVAETGEKSKYEKLREQKVQEEVKKEDPASIHFTRFAFAEYMDKDWFKKDFENAKDSGEAPEYAGFHVGRRYWEQTFALGIDKVVLVDPYFARVNARKRESYKYIESEYGQVNFSERLKANAKKAKLDIEVLNTKNLKESETDKLNDVSIMNEYIMDRLGLEDGVSVPFAERDRIRELAKKYGTDYFMWTGNISLTDKNRLNGLLIAYSIILPVIMPFTMPQIVNGGQFTMYFALLYDVRTDELKMTTYREIRNRTKGYILNSHIYDVFNQVKSTKK